MQKDISISVVIPVYKSASTLAELHERLGKVSEQQNWDLEIIYVNDASPDNSSAIIKNLPKSSRFKQVKLMQNMGQSTALLCGFAVSGGDLIVTMDADLQDEPESLPLLVQNLKKGTDVIFATRSGQYQSNGRLLTSLFFKSLVSKFTNGRIPKFAGLFMVIRQTAVADLLQYLPDKPYLIGLIGRHRLSCEGYEILRQKNQFNETSYSLKKRLLVALQFFKTLLIRPSLKPIEVRDWLKKNLIEIP